jgi:hypothetical protein
MKIGLIPMSAKPYHAGHDGLVRLACRECDIVQLFVGITDRKRPGEIPIYAGMMREIWSRFIEKTLPGNCNIPIYSGVGQPPPVGKMYEFLLQQESQGSDDTFVIYSDDEDIKSYTEEKMKKYFPTLMMSGQLLTRGVKRTETVPVSGTKMRNFIKVGDVKSFTQFLPEKLRQYSDEIFKILTTKTIVKEAFQGRQTDTLAKKIVSKIIDELKLPENLEMLVNKESTQVIVTSEELGHGSNVPDYVQLNFDFDPRLGMQEIDTRTMLVKTTMSSRIEIELTYPDRPFRLKDIADIYPEILENVRHELEHFLQPSNDANESSPDELETLHDFVKYYTDPTEVEAFVVGLMSKAKNTRQPLRALLSGKLEAISNDAEDAGISEIGIQELISKIENAYTSYAKKRYGK